MANENNQLRDGVNFTAYANYYNPSSALAGPSGSGQFLGMIFQAPRVAQFAATIGTGPVIGILQNTPAAGENCDICFMGVSKMIAGASITAGAELMVDASGRMITWVAGSGYYKCGYAIETVTAANDMFTGMVYSTSQGVT